ncbi:hypothetical protein Poli38472_012005 [Pythium oligandrum]|uniref:Uncharacterized protein n=1 Tax=Pythium oligandrum TaxID=41045 RepID=A0A8K1CPJ4_PYTOL|nr:hypothetical protein Poli38472_012005 [Pythium oligandrum]|eukprot:TMW66889.1 hypothetical protein Poli38472_012005 [Pythium oligandrum]
MQQHVERSAPVQIRGSPRLHGFQWPSSTNAVHPVSMQDLNRHHHHGHVDYVPHRVRRDVNTPDGIVPNEWICSPLLDGFPSFHSSVIGSEGASTSLGLAASHDELNCSLPYLGTCWSHDHNNNARIEPIHTNNVTIEHPETPHSEEWEYLKRRSFSTDFPSPVQLETFAPLFFPMDPDTAMASSERTAESSHVQNFQHPPSSNQCESPMEDIPVSHQHTMPASTQGMWQEMHEAPSDLIAPHDAMMDASVFQGHSQESESSNPPLFTSPHGLPPTSTMLCPPPRHESMSSFASLPYHPAPRPTPQSPLFADVQLLTKLNHCYWKNGRKNLQCFPVCPEHNDFYSMKMNNRKHSSVGVCRGPVYCHAFLPASTTGTVKPEASGHHMKYEFGVGATGTGGSGHEVFVLGKFERVPQQNEMHSLEELLPPPLHFTSSADFEAFRYSCFQAVEMEERRVLLQHNNGVVTPSTTQGNLVRSTWFFLPDVWKVQPMLKKKRKATRSAPAQTFPFCFRIFIYTRDPVTPSNEPAYRCLASTSSSFFELYSTRTVDRVKRKYWTSSSTASDGVDTPLPPHTEPTKPSSMSMTMRATKRLTR